MYILVFNSNHAMYLSLSEQIPILCIELWRSIIGFSVKQQSVSGAMQLYLSRF